ncbi:MAG TPA: LysR family transcriptional regulator [Candidatus Ligilactobacillus excrementipullorum]|nr:LysR family transcriptional regulator [Candidatus Ligilactobacillus excrementipullorum]
MNFTQLRCFVRTIDNSSFTIAAESLNFSQSAVSKNIKDLENEVGVILINRAHHRISLTEAGKYFYKIANNILQEMDYSVAYLRGQKNGVGTLLRIGFFNSPFEQQIMPFVLRNLKKFDPDLNAQFSITLKDTIAALLNHHIDVCLVPHDVVANIDGLNFEPLVTGRLVVACSHDSNLRKKQQVSVQDLKKQNIFLIEPDTTLHFQTKFQNYLVTELGTENVKYVQDFFTMLIYVKAGWGIGVLPNFIADLTVQEVSFIPLASREIPPYGIAYVDSVRESIAVDPVISAFKMAITEYLRKP